LTAEIVIMNLNAVALAADSAATVTPEKISQTANKIFMLSKYEPVGILIYGNSSILRIPWELIIKQFRKNLGTTKFNTLEEYFKQFINFIETELKLFPEQIQMDFIKKYIRTYYRHFLNQSFVFLNERYDELTNAEDFDPQNEDEIKELMDETFIETADLFKHVLLIEMDFLKPFEGIDDDFVQSITNELPQFLQSTITDVLELYPPSEKLIEVLVECGLLLFKNFIKAPRFNKMGEETSFVSISPISGIVVTGFGEDDYFPKMISIQLDGMLKNKIRYKILQKVSINAGEKSVRSSITPFAQTEMVASFMDGIDPGYSRYIKKSLRKMFDKLPETIIGSLEVENGSNEIDNLDKLNQIFKDELKKLFDDFGKFEDKNLSGPITRSVNFLSKDELATMAETLVQLTSFKKKVTFGVPETVGGPVDVAVISKGDGFIWIKRKHYFDPNLNSHFLKNYYNN